MTQIATAFINNHTFVISDSKFIDRQTGTIGKIPKVFIINKKMIGATLGNGPGAQMILSKAIQKCETVDQAAEALKKEWDCYLCTFKKLLKTSQSFFIIGYDDSQFIMRVLHGDVQKELEIYDCYKTNKINVFGPKTIVGLPDAISEFEMIYENHLPFEKRKTLTPKQIESALINACEEAIRYDNAESIDVPVSGWRLDSQLNIARIGNYVDGIGTIKELRVRIKNILKSTEQTNFLNKCYDSIRYFLLKCRCCFIVFLKRTLKMLHYK